MKLEGVGVPIICGRRLTTSSNGSIGRFVLSRTHAHTSHASEERGSGT